MLLVLMLREALGEAADELRLLLDVLLCMLRLCTLVSSLDMENELLWILRLSAAEIVELDCSCFLGVRLLVLLFCKLFNGPPLLLLLLFVREIEFVFDLFTDVVVVVVGVFVSVAAAGVLFDVLFDAV